MKRFATIALLVSGDGAVCLGGEIALRQMLHFRQKLVGQN
jgi:hypothetical protein